MAVKLLSIFFLLVPELVLGCAGGPKHGYGLSLSELVKRTDNIVLAEFIEKGDRYEFKAKKILKSLDNSQITNELSRFWRTVGRSHIKLGKNHESEDFSEHTDKRFWANEAVLQNELISRVPWKGGMCTPAFTFLNGELYLLFLNSPGSFYAAEIIKSDNDK